LKKKLKRLRVFEEIEPQGKAVEVTVNSGGKEENSNSSDFCLDFVQEFVLCLILFVISCACALKVFTVLPAGHI
jgi:hypothetical protein